MMKSRCRSFEVMCMTDRKKNDDVRFDFRS